MVSKLRIIWKQTVQPQQQRLAPPEPPVLLGSTMLAQKLRRGVVAGLGSIVVGSGPPTGSSDAAAPNRLGTPLQRVCRVAGCLAAAGNCVRRLSSDRNVCPGAVELDQASSLVWVDGLLALYDSEPDAHLSASRLALLSWKDRLAHGPVPRGLSPRGDWKPERSAVIEL